MPISLAHSEPFRLDWSRHAQAAPRPAMQLHAQHSAAAAADAAKDDAFVALQGAYRRHGGISRGEPLAACLARAGLGGYVELARRIVQGDLFSFRWHDSFWLPLFQFDPVRLTPREAPRRVLRELHGVLDGWDIAQWYVRPNNALGGACPMDLLKTDLPAVLAAARADRYAVDA